MDPSVMLCVFQLFRYSVVHNGAHKVAMSIYLGLFLLSYRLLREVTWRRYNIRELLTHLL